MHNQILVLSKQVYLNYLHLDLYWSYYILMILQIT